MSFLLPQLSENLSGVTYGIVGITAAIVVTSGLLRGPNLSAFPTVGPSSLFSSWLVSKFGSPLNGTEIAQEGYEKHKPAPFKLAVRYGWVVVLSDRKHLEEVARAPEDEFSLARATNEQLNFDCTLGSDILDAPYHITVIRSRLTRSLGTIYPDIRDEIVTAFDDILDLTGHEWKSVPALGTVHMAICRTSNRLLVGLPLCRNREWIELNVRSTLHIVQEGLGVGHFPKFLRPLAARFFPGVARDIQQGIRLLGPTIEERLKAMKEYGNKWPDQPNDLLSMLMEEAEGPQLTVRSLVIRTLVYNFFALNTSSNSFTHALLYLAANPQYIQPLREEVESVIEKEGWSRASLGKMHHIDSFLRESQRIEGSNNMTLGRLALKDFTFSDGTFIPKGTVVVAPVRAIQHDEKHYENANVFKPFRFVGVPEDEGEGVKHQFVSTGVEYLPFGHGKLSCPGRFFAATELKTMLAHIVTTYDVKVEGNTRPASLYMGTMTVPDPRAKVLFRKRVV